MLIFTLSLEGRSVFVNLPTGYGQLLIFQCHRCRRTARYRLFQSAKTKVITNRETTGHHAPLQRIMSRKTDSFVCHHFICLMSFYMASLLFKLTLRSRFTPLELRMGFGPSTLFCQILLGNMPAEYL